MIHNSSKFYSKSLILLISILEMIKEGTIAANIARVLNLKKSHVSYYIRKAKDSHYVREVTRDSFSALELTEAGKTLLDQYNKNNPSPMMCRAENIRFKAAITQMPTIPVDWKKIEMHNWTQYTSQIDSVKVRINTGNPHALELIPSPVDGDDPFGIFVIIVFECVNVILKLNDMIGLKVGPLQLGSRGEWLVYDPIARVFSKTNGQVTYEGVAKINASRPRSIGEFEFFDPRALLSYLLMPARVARIDATTQSIEGLMEKLIKNSEPERSTLLLLPTLFTVAYFCCSRFSPMFIF